ncbi:MAG: hypothetical protein JW850_08055 [Thermoflexales bacterium]|nr:hypothetical protein [Thermoflexales bacterium]
MKILAIEHEMPDIPAERFQPHLRAEAARVWELYQAGILREIYFRQNQSTSVLILECAGVEEAEQVLGTLPLIKEGLITFEVIPLRPYPGMARLFASQESCPP